MTAIVVYLDEPLARLEATDHRDWLAWLTAVGLDPLELACPSELTWNEATGRLSIETLRYDSLGRIGKKKTMTIVGEVPPIPDGFPLRKQRARRQTIYLVIQGYAWMDNSSSGINYTADPERFDTLELAIDHGFKIAGSDDFNIGKLEYGRLVAMLWMDQLLPYTRSDLLRIAKDAGLR